MKERNYEPPPLSAYSLMESFDNGPLPELYNVIYATMYEHFSLNEHGYAKIDSSNIATKIWSIALDWESLISRQKNSKQAMLGLTVHRLTGSKEAAQNLHGLGHSISYNDILKYNEFWSRSQPPCHKVFSSTMALHSSIDNNDGRQETITGAGTTHDTLSTTSSRYCKLSFFFFCCHDKIVSRFKTQIYCGQWFVITSYLVKLLTPPNACRHFMKSSETFRYKCFVATFLYAV